MANIASENVKLSEGNVILCEHNFFFQMCNDFLNVFTYSPISHEDLYYLNISR